MQEPSSPDTTHTTKAFLLRYEPIEQTTPAPRRSTLWLSKPGCRSKTCTVGANVGANEGAAVGEVDGLKEGLAVALAEGLAVALVGAVGTAIGAFVG